MLWPEASVIQFTNSLKPEKYILVIKSLNGETNNTIEVSLTNLRFTFQDRIIKEQFKEMAAVTRLEIEEFNKLTITALTTGSENGSFLYEVTEKDDEATLSWKYKPSEEIKFLLGSIKLKAVEHVSSLSSMLIGLGKQINSLTEENKVITKEKESLEKERDGLVQFMEKRVLEKDELELQMYAKFVCVLNEKKNRARKRQELPSSSDSDVDTPKKSDQVEETAAATKSVDLGLNLSDSLEDSIPEPSQVKRKLVKKIQEMKESPTKKLRSPPPPPFNDSSDTTDADSDDLLNKI